MPTIIEENKLPDSQRGEPVAGCLTIPNNTHDDNYDDTNNNNTTTYNNTNTYNKPMNTNNTIYNANSK